MVHGGRQAVDCHSPSQVLIFILTHLGRALTDSQRKTSPSESLGAEQENVLQGEYGNCRDKPRSVFRKHYQPHTSNTELLLGNALLTGFSKLPSENVI